MIGVELNGRVIKLRTPFSMKDRCMAVPGGVWSNITKTWNYPLTPATANTIFGLFNGDLPSEIYDHLDQIRSVFAKNKQIKDAPDSQVPDVPTTKTKPWNHQKKAYQFAVKALGLDR